ncbi:SUN domain-containing protein 3 [Macrotis lagotis]|uniref:SUN domain-containing protein 3 n=1 Tax=Macrotis lagotis TaxID=92651 RepID=UPI003D681FF8
MERLREYLNLNQEYITWKKITLSLMLILTFLFVGLYSIEKIKRTEFSQLPKQLYEISDYEAKLTKYQAKMHMSNSNLELLKKGMIILEKNNQEILLLTRQIEMMKALFKDVKIKLENFNVHHPEKDNFEQENDSDINNKTRRNLEEIMYLVEYVLKRHREDQVQMADYALKSSGASIIEEETSANYKNDQAKLIWHEIRFLSYEIPPDVILKPDVHPGNCWAFPGREGHTTIKLARKIIPTAVTMEHISQKVSPSGNIFSAPKDFAVYGLKNECKGEEIFLGLFMYNTKGITVQTFWLQNGIFESLTCVKLKILNNWGNPNYTCLYRFRVHGNPGNDEEALKRD